MKSIAFLLPIFLLAGAFQLQAQKAKYGYLNSSQIILMHPEIKSADQKLTNFQNELIAKGEKMAKQLETNYTAYVNEANNGALSKLQMQEKEAGLAKEQDAIRQFEIDMQQKMLTKREELYQPILDKIQAAVEAVGKEEGYYMIFDTSSGGILHADPANDLFEKVKAKLNL